MLSKYDEEIAKLLSVAPPATLLIAKKIRVAPKAEERSFAKLCEVTLRSGTPGRAFVEITALDRFVVGVHELDIGFRSFGASCRSVTSGTDFGLSVAAELASEFVAHSIQLGIEYDPAPPFDAGHPDRAPAAAKDKVSGRYERMRDLFRASLEGPNVG